MTVENIDSLTALQKVSIAPWCLPAVHAINPDGTGVTRPTGVWAGLWRPHSSPADSGCKSATQQLPQMGNFGFIVVPWEEVQPGRPSVMLKTSRGLQGDIFCPNSWKVVAGCHWLNPVVITLFTRSCREDAKIFKVKVVSSGLYTADIQSLYSYFAC